MLWSNCNLYVTNNALFMHAQLALIRRNHFRLCHSSRVFQRVIHCTGSFSTCDVIIRVVWILWFYPDPPQSADWQGYKCCTRCRLLAVCKATFVTVKYVRFQYSSPFFGKRLTRNPFRILACRTMPIKKTIKLVDFSHLSADTYAKASIKV